MLTSIIITSSVVEWFYRLTAKVSLGDRGEGGGAVNRLQNLRSYLAKYTKLSVSLIFKNLLSSLIFIISCLLQSGRDTNSYCGFVCCLPSTEI